MINNPAWKLTTLKFEKICSECGVIMLTGAEVFSNLGGDSFICSTHTSMLEELESDVNEVVDNLFGKKRSRFMRIVLSSSVIAVIGVIVFLSLELPGAYKAENWDLAWVGFDCGLLATLMITLWAVLKHRQIGIISSAMAGLLLIVDSWFDVATSQGGRDFLVALATAIFLQLPFAFVLFKFSQNMMRRSMDSTYQHAGIPSPDFSLFKAPLTIPKNK